MASAQKKDSCASGLLFEAAAGSHARNCGIALDAYPNLPDLYGTSLERETGRGKTRIGARDCDAECLAWFEFSPLRAPVKPK